MDGRNKWTAGSIKHNPELYDQIYGDFWTATIDYNFNRETNGITYGGWLSQIEVHGGSREEAELLRDVILEHLRHGNY